MPSYTNNTTPAQLVAQQPPKQPLVSHVNMQLDSFIANSGIEDLRAIVRTLLATGPAGTTSTFTKIARNRIQHTTSSKVPPPESYFVKDATTGHGVPTKKLWEGVARARNLFGLGLGFESIPILISIINISATFTCAENSEMEDALITIDADIAQALQSCREQLQADLVADRDAARTAVDNLRASLEACRTVVEARNADFLYERAVMSITTLKV